MRTRTIRRKTTIALTLFFLLASLLRQSVAEGKTTNRVSCDPVGRVLSRGFLNFASGSLLCKGDRLQVVNATKAELLCFSSGRIVTVTDNLKDASKCDSSVERRGLWRCIAEFIPRSCVLPSNNPVLTSPYRGSRGSALINNRPFLSWQPVVKATSYIVEIDGPNVHWRKTVDGTTLLYPKEQPAMQFGNAYKVNVITYQADSPVSASSAVFNVLSESKAKQVKTVVKRIQSLNLSPDEQAYLDLNAIYGSEGLYTEAINLLKARAKAGSQNPGVYRTLGEFYLEALLPDLAENEFKIATKLAQAADNHIEFKKAQAGLEIVKRYRSAATQYAS